MATMVVGCIICARVHHHIYHILNYHIHHRHTRVSTHEGSYTLIHAHTMSHTCTRTHAHTSDV